MSEEKQLEIATLAGGCFWCLEAVFKDVEGVVSTVSGYTGGKVKNPTYEQVCRGDTGHAEAVQVTFDPQKITYREILEIFFSVHDPTTPNRQGNDVGTQYRSAIFYDGPEQKETAGQLIRELGSMRLWKGSIVTEVKPLTEFYPAEEYHRDYFAQHPEQAYCQSIIAPKVGKFRKRWANKLKTK